MIDLSKTQIVEPAIEAWFKDSKSNEWLWDSLLHIDHRLSFPFATASGARWQQCSLTNPDMLAIKYWKRVEDVPYKLWGNALFKRIGSENYKSLILYPSGIIDSSGNILTGIEYLPFGFRLTDKWLPLGECIENE